MELELLATAIAGQLVATIVGLLLGYAICLRIEHKSPQKREQLPTDAAASRKLEDFSDGQIDREFKRRAELQMRPANERAAKLAEDAWDKGRW